MFSSPLNVRTEERVQRAFAQALEFCGHMTKIVAKEACNKSVNQPLLWSVFYATCYPRNDNSLYSDAVRLALPVYMIPVVDT